MNCRKCDQPLDEGAEFCGNCGSAVNPARHPVPPVVEIAREPKPAGDARLNGHATGALVLGIMAIPASLVFFLGIPVSISAFTLGVMGRRSTKGKRAVAGMVLACLAITLTFLIFVPMLGDTVEALAR